MKLIKRCILGLLCKMVGYFILSWLILGVCYYVDIENCGVRGFIKNCLGVSVNGDLFLFLDCS